MVREGLRKILIDTAPGIEVAGLAADGREALALVEERRPEVILMDIRMPVMNGIDATAAITAKYPATKVVALTTFDDDDYLVDAVRAGAVAYLLKDVPLEELLEAIRKAAAGQSVIPGKLARRLAERAHLAKGGAAPGDEAARQRIALSERETEILCLLAEGLENADIAARLNLSLGTVKNYVSRIYDKLEARDRTHAIIQARKHGLIE